MNAVVDRLAADRRDVEAALRLHLRSERGAPDRLRRAMAHALFAGGKRLRPLLVLGAAEACGGRRVRKHALAAGAALEMVHTYSLVHDDLPAMDDDDLRRGRPTCHVAFDEATAVLAGDALLTRAFGVAASVPRHGADLAVMLAAAAGQAGMVGGQQLDLDAEGQDLTPALVRRIHTGKTARLIAVALTMGACVGGAKERTLTDLEKAGLKLGLAFQAADDVLDATADTATLGKTAGKDERDAKPTWVRLEGVDKARRRTARLGREGTTLLAGALPTGAATDRLVALCRRLWDRDR